MSLTGVVLVCIIGFFGAAVLSLAIKVNREWEEAVILRLGKFQRIVKSGIYLIIPAVEQFYRLSLRIQVMDVPPQKIITKDSVTVQVDAVVYYRISDIKKAVLNIENWENASTLLAQTTLRDKVGQHDLDDLLTKKEMLGKEIKDALDPPTDKWGISIEGVEIKNVIIPTDMERAMAKEAEAFREKRSRITKAEGELIASQKLKEAGDLLAQGSGLVIRQLQTWQEIGAEQNSLIVVVPMDFPITKDAMGLTALGRTVLQKEEGK